MAVLNLSCFATAILLIFGSIVVVRCELSLVEKSINKVNGNIHQDHSIDDNEKPIIEQPEINKLDLDINIPSYKAETKGQSSEAKDVFERIQSRMSKMMDCILDGMKHQTNYGWSGIPDMMESRIGKLSSDAKQFLKELSPPSSEGGKKTSNVGQLGDLPTKASAAVAQENKEDGYMYRPVLHRFIIIKKLPLLSYDDGSYDKESVEGSQSRMKEFFNSFLGTSPDGNEKTVMKNLDEMKMSVAVNNDDDDKPLIHDGIVKESKGKLCDFLTNLAYKSGLKRTTLILLMTAILLCFAWYCMATVLSSRRRKAEQNLKMTIEGGDMEYLIPIEEKFLFFAPLDDKEKLKLGDMVQAPSLPIKIKIQDV